MERFKDLKDSKILNVIPDRIRIRLAPKEEPLRQVLLALSVPENKPKMLAIMNGKSLNERVTAETLMKLVAK